MNDDKYESVCQQISCILLCTKLWSLESSELYDDGEIDWTEFLHTHVDPVELRGYCCVVFQIWV